MASLTTPEGHSKELIQSEHLLGSEAPADIIVLASMGIAPQQYRLSQDETGWQLTPLGPIGSTFLNGTPVSKATHLKHGDQISAGQLALTFADPQPVTQPATPPTPPPTPPPAKAQPSVAKPPPNSAVASLAKPRPSLSDRQTRKTSPTGKRSKLPLFALIMLTLLGGGGLAAWKSGLIDRHLAPTNETAVSPQPEPLTATQPSAGSVSVRAETDTASPKQTHFDVLSSYTPPEANVAFTITPSELLKTYDKWQAEFTDLPPLKELIEGARETTGFDLNSIVRASVTMSASPQSVTSMTPTPDDSVSVLTFDSPVSMEQMVAQLRKAGSITRLESSHPQPVYKWTRNDSPGPEMFAFLDGNNLVASTIGHTKLPGQAQVIRQLTDQLSARSSAFAAVLSLPSDLDTSALPIPQGYTLPESAVVSLEFTEGFNVFAKASFSDPAKASQMAQQLKESISAIGKNISGPQGSEINPLLAILLRTKHQQDGSSVEMELPFSEFELRMILSPIIASTSEFMATADASKAKRDAQICASLCAAAQAAGSLEMDEVTNTKDAVEILLKGIKGGQDGPFAERSFQAPSMTEPAIEAALKHLAWEEHGLVYIAEPQEHASHSR